jgi:hypothetical protein
MVENYRCGVGGSLKISWARVTEATDVEFARIPLPMMLLTVVVGRPSVAAQPMVKACLGVCERWYIRRPLRSE